ncbi:MAG TPA: erythromycin esterase family protein [Longimicrobium sp.]
MLSLLKRRPFHALLALLLLTACESSDPVEPGEEFDLGWLEANAVAFTTTDPGGGYADLAPLGPMIGDARIVALGEATHGTREFFRMKHRIVEYLVKEKGFSTFAIEATWPEANLLNRYVHTGEGDPAELLAGLHFWTWNTAEVLEMIRWMRAHNQNPGGAPRVSFYGFDMQYSRMAMNQVVAYLRGLDAAAADSAQAHYACYREFQDTTVTQNYGAAPGPTRDLCRAGVQAAYALVERGQARWAPRSGAAEYATALRAARIVVQNEDVRGNPLQGSVLRDTYMAENVEWLADQAGPGSRLVLWAHNAHVSRAEPWMGTRLQARYGAAYRPVGFSFYSGSFNAVIPIPGISPSSQLGVAEIPDSLTSPRSYNHQFHRLGVPRFIVNLQPLRDGAPRGAEWLLGPRHLRMIGAGYDASRQLNSYVHSELVKEYDIMIHIEKSTPTQRLLFGDSQ